MHHTKRGLVRLVYIQNKSNRGKTNNQRANQALKGDTKKYFSNIAKFKSH